MRLSGRQFLWTLVHGFGVTVTHLYKTYGCVHTAVYVPLPQLLYLINVLSSSRLPSRPKERAKTAIRLRGRVLYLSRSLWLGKGRWNVIETCRVTAGHDRYNDGPGIVYGDRLEKRPVLDPSVYPNRNA